MENGQLRQAESELRREKFVLGTRDGNDYVRWNAFNDAVNLELEWDQLPRVRRSRRHDLVPVQIFEVFAVDPDVR